METEVGEQAAVIVKCLLQRGCRYSFFQAMRLLRAVLGPRALEEDGVRVRPDISLSFPPADITRIEVSKGDKPGFLITVTFLGLYGVSSFLPTHYPEDILDEAADDESAQRDFLDILHQRIYSLLFECWSKYRLDIKVLEERSPGDIQRLFCLIGLGVGKLAETVPDAWQLLRYTDLISLFPRSARGLEKFLREEMEDKRITIIQNVKRMAPIPQDQRMRLGNSCCTLGVDALLGSRIADVMGKFRVRYKNLTWKEYNDLTPGTLRYNKIANRIKSYLPDPLDADLELALLPGEAHPLRLGDPNARLGLNTWCFSGATLGGVSAVHPLTLSPEPDSPLNTEIGLACPHRGKPVSTFIDCYQGELSHFRRLADNYGEAHPDLASMVTGHMADPAAERLFQGYGFMNAALRQKLDDDIPEFINELTFMLQPHYVRDFPCSTTVVISPAPEFAQPCTIPAGARLAVTPADETECRFRTCYDIEIAPLTLVNACLTQVPGQSPAIKLSFRLYGISVDRWRPKSLRIFLGGEFALAADIYLLLLRRLSRIMITSQGGHAVSVLQPESLRASGFAPDETMIPSPPHALHGYRILQEYYLYREKFLYIEIHGGERWFGNGHGGDSFEISFELNGFPSPLPSVTGENFVLFATPVINLFSSPAQPVTVTRRDVRHRLASETDEQEHCRIYSVDKVSGVVRESSRRKTYIRKGFHIGARHADNLFHTTVEKRLIEDECDTFLSFDDAVGSKLAQEEQILIDLTCTNGSFPERIETGVLWRHTSDIPDLVEIRNIRPVTPAVPPPIGGNRLWRLYSNLVLNFASLQNVQSFRAMLGEYLFPERRDRRAVKADEKRIAGIEEINAGKTSRVTGGILYPGIDVRLSLRRDHFTSLGDLFLFASVIERFLGGYVMQNEFIRLTVEVAGEKEVFRWPERMGDRPLV